MFPVLAVHFLIPRVPGLRRRFPDVGFEISADVASVNVLKREADIAIRTYPEGRAPAEPSALAMKVGNVGFALYASKGYIERHGRPERPVRALAGHEMIAMGKGDPGSAWNAQLEEPADCSISVYPGLAVTAALHADLGLGVLLCVEGDADPRLIRVSDVLGTHPLWVVTSDAARNNARVRAVKDVLVEMIRDATPQLDGSAMR